MSGLTLFFRQNLDVEPPVNDYQRSLATLGQPLPLPIRNKSMAGVPASRGNDTCIWSDPLDFEGWREQRNQLLHQFMEKRIMDPQDEDDDEEEDEDEPMAESQDSFDDDNMLETQPMDLPVPQSDQRPAERRPKELPHFSETLHDVEHLADVDLYTRQLHLRLCAVDKVWSIRDTRRFAVKQGPGGLRGESEHAWYTSTPVLPRLALKNCECDGPLATIYKQTLVLEARQLQVPSELRRRAEYLQQQDSPGSRRIKVFLHNVFAKLVAEVLAKRPKTARRLLIGLENVPARCIIPYAASDWYDEQQSDYCISIGSKSMLKAEIEEGRYRMRFVEADTVIHIGWEEGGGLQESTIVPHSKEEAVLEERSDRPLATAFRRWKRATEGPDEILDEETPVRPVAPQQLEAEQAAGINRQLLAEFEQDDSEEAKSDDAPPERRVPPAQQLPERLFSARKTRPTYSALNELLNIYETHTAMERHQDVAKPEPCLANVFGVVLGFGSPSCTKRGDWFMGVALVDDSIPLASELGSLVEFVQTVNVNIFVKNKEDLPDIRQAGDVLRCHRVKVQKWNGELQLLGIRQSSYVLCRGNSDDPADASAWKVIPTAKTAFELASPQDPNRFKQLWHWGVKRFLSHASMKLSSSFKLGDLPSVDNQIASLSSDFDHGDITLMVSTIIPVNRQAEQAGVLPHGFLRVWDGTGLSHSDPMPHPSAAPFIEGGDPSSLAIVRLAGIVRKLRFIKQNKDLEPPKALCGRVVNVCIWESSHWDLVTKVVKAGSFIRLRNIRVDVMPDGLCCLMVGSKSYLTPLPGLTFEVVQLIEEHNDRLLRGEPPNPQSGILPLQEEELGRITAPVVPPTDPPRVREPVDQTQAAIQPASPPAPAAPQEQASPVQQYDGSLDRLEQLVSGPVPSIYKGLVRVTDTTPPLSSLYAPGALQRIIAINADAPASYRFAVNVTDSTSSLMAIVTDESGVALTGLTADTATTNASGVLFNLQQEVESGSSTPATIRSVLMKGSKFFILESVGRR